MKCFKYVCGVMSLSTICCIQTVWAGESSFSANIGVASNHLWRGFVSDQPIVSGGLNYFHESGLYAGTWVVNNHIPRYTSVLTGIGNPNDPNDDQYAVVKEDDPGYELDLYAGYGSAIGDIGYDLSVMHTRYPAHPNDNLDYTELTFKLSFKQFVTSISYDADADDETLEGSLYYMAGVTFDLPKEMSVGLTIGRYDFNPDYVFVRSYNHAQLDFVKKAGDLGDFTASLSIAEKAANGDEDLRAVISWTKTFY